MCKMSCDIHEKPSFSFCWLCSWLGRGTSIKRQSQQKENEGFSWISQLILHMTHSKLKLSYRNSLTPVEHWEENFTNFYVHFSNHQQWFLQIPRNSYTEYFRDVNFLNSLTFPVILSCSRLFVDIAIHFAHGAFKIKIPNWATDLYLYIRNNDMHISPYVGGHRMVLHSLFQNMYSL
jgi:hypothetical protein